MADVIFNLPDFDKDVKYYRSFQKTLEGATYTFIVQYNSRMDRYLMRIGSDVNGISIQNGIDLLKQLHHLDVPPGELRLLDYDGFNRDPQKATFGARITFIYTESE